MMMQHKNTLKGAISGFRKNIDGTISEAYDNPTYYSSVHFRKTLYSIVASAGLIGGLSIKKAERSIDNYVNSNLYNLSLSRRNFIRAAALTVITGSIASCKKDDDIIDNIIDPPIPVISGPSELTIPRVGMGAHGEFNSAGTIGAKDLYWNLTKPIGMVDNIEHIGSGTISDIKFAIPGINEVQLIADNASGRSRLSQMVKINPPKLPSQNYDLPLLLSVKDSGSSFALYTLDINSMETTKLFSGEKLYDYARWDPTGERLVTITFPGPKDTHYPDTPYKITTYNLLTGSFKIISNNTSGLVCKPVWSPKGDWIAYLDDSETPNHAIDEISLVRPDGSEQFYLGGNNHGPETAGVWLSWDPEGIRLVAGGAIYTGLKLSVFDNLFNGHPTYKRIPTDEQKSRYYDAEAETFKKRGLEKNTFMRYFLAGANGVAWSPRGDIVMYTANFGLSPDNGYQAILASSIDGSGDIQTIVRNLDIDELNQDLWLPRSPTWTPDGLNIYFSASKYGIDRLFKYDIIAKNYSEVDIPLVKIRNPGLYS